MFEKIKYRWSLYDTMQKTLIIGYVIVALILIGIFSYRDFKSERVNETTIMYYKEIYGIKFHKEFRDIEVPSMMDK